jgi:hypothetical protein
LRNNQNLREVAGCAVRLLFASAEWQVGLAQHGESASATVRMPEWTDTKLRPAFAGLFSLLWLKSYEIDAAEPLER